MSKKIWTEWLIPVADFHESITKEERNFEIVIPIIGSIIAVVICGAFQIVNKAVTQLEALLPTVLAILIGFIISAISIVSTSSSDEEELVNKQTNRTMNKKTVLFRQYFLGNLIYYTILLIVFLVLLFVFPLLRYIIKFDLLSLLILFIYCYLLLRILLGIIKLITQMYFIYFRGAPK